MSEDSNDEETKAAAAPAGDKPKAPERAEAEPSALDLLATKVTNAANDFLKERLGLAPGADGSLEPPDQRTFEDIGQRADQFIRGFFMGFVDKTPEERAAMSEGSDPNKAPPSGTEVLGRLLSKVSETVSGSFHEYLKEHAVDAAKPDEPVVIDGAFVLRHGGPLLTGFVQALGTSFKKAENTAEPLAPAEPEPVAEGRPHVDYRVDLPSVFKSMFVRKSSDQGDRHEP